MRKLAYIIFIMALSMKYTYGQLPAADPNWQLVFSDDFSGTTLDTSKWSQIPMSNQYGNIYNSTWCTNNPYNLSYKKWYLDSITHAGPDTTNCKVNNNSLKLYARKENYTGEVWSWPGGVFTTSFMQYKYTTGMLYSKYKFRYGYFEIKFKLPPAPTSPQTYQGYGPNFWLYKGQDPPATPTYSEIDVFEIDAYNASKSHNNYYTMNSHFARDTFAASMINDYFPQGNLSSPNTWHTAAANWTPTKIEYYFDGVKLFETNVTRPDSMIAMPLWVDINTPASGFCSNWDTLNTAPVYSYELDYVKVYQKKMQCDTNKTYCNVSSSTYQNKVYQSLTIGGSGCTANISNGAATSCLGNTSVKLDEGFMIDLGTECYIDVLPCEVQENIRFYSITPQKPPYDEARKMKYHFPD